MNELISFEILSYLSMGIYTVIVYFNDRLLSIYLPAKSLALPLRLQWFDVKCEKLLID